MNVDVIMQGKGGVGKSVVAAMLTQHYMAHDVTPICVDTDPVNQTFAGYKAFNVRRLDIMDGEDINQRAFDDLIEIIMASDDKNATLVADNGAASFVPLGSYLVSGDVLPMLAEAGHNVRLHTVLTGGQALEDTFKGLLSLANNFPKTPLVVWMNEFFGPIEAGGVPVEKSKEYKALLPRISSQVAIPRAKAETFGHDLKAMLSLRLTFAEAIKYPGFSVMARQRLKMYWLSLSAGMDQAGL